jgi:hypothetical protein
MATAKQRFWTLVIRRRGRFCPEFGSFVRGEAIEKMSELRVKGVPRVDLKVIASDPDRVMLSGSPWSATASLIESAGGVVAASTGLHFPQSIHV